jgi:hypothetical protein
MINDLLTPPPTWREIIRDAWLDIVEALVRSETR